MWTTEKYDKRDVGRFTAQIQNVVHRPETHPAAFDVRLPPVHAVAKNHFVAAIVASCISLIVRGARGFTGQCDLKPSGDVQIRNGVRVSEVSQPIAGSLIVI